MICEKSRPLPQVCSKTDEQADSREGHPPPSPFGPSDPPPGSKPFGNNSLGWPPGGVMANPADRTSATARRSRRNLSCERRAVLSLDADRSGHRVLLPYQDRPKLFPISVPGAAVNHRSFQSQSSTDRSNSCTAAPESAVPVEPLLPERVLVWRVWSRTRPSCPGQLCPSALAARLRDPPAWPLFFRVLQDMHAIVSLFWAKPAQRGSYLGGTKMLLCELKSEGAGGNIQRDGKMAHDHVPFGYHVSAEPHRGHGLGFIKPSGFLKRSGPKDDPAQVDGLVFHRKGP